VDFSVSLSRKPAERARLVSVQWLRGIAALMVVVHHILFYTNQGVGLGIDAPRVLFGFDAWHFGLHIFFLVSGFIMITTVTEFGSFRAAIGFAERRLVRIVPLYWLITSVAVAAALLSPSSIQIAGDRFQYFLDSYLFIPALRAPGDARPVLGQGWTLNCEMVFYALFALSLLLPRRKALAFLAIAFAGLCFMGRYVTIETPVLYTWTDGILLEFGLGVVVGLIYQAGWRLSRALACASIVAGFALISLAWQGPVVLVSGIPAALVLMGFVLGPQPEATPSVKLSRGGRWLAVVGDASYSLYLTHTLIIHALWRIYANHGGAQAPKLIFVVFAGAVSLVVALVTYRFVERPMTQTLHRWVSNRRPARRMPAAPSLASSS